MSLANGLFFDVTGQAETTGRAQGRRESVHH